MSSLFYIAADIDFLFSKILIKSLLKETGRFLKKYKHLAKNKKKGMIPCYSMSTLKFSLIRGFSREKSKIIFLADFAVRTGCLFRR